MNGRTVLLVDDSELILQMVGATLTDSGFEVQTARDGYQAIQACYALIPDIIVMDLDMPRMKGYQASRLLKARRGVKDIPIVMHTGTSEDKDRFWAYNSGACAYVVKDFEHLEPLVECVRRNIVHDAPDLAAIREDAAGMDRDRISELLSSLLDRELFQSTIMNQLSDAARSLSSLSATAARILELLDLACERQVGALILRVGKAAQPYLWPSTVVNRDMSDDLLSVSLEDFYRHFDQSQAKPEQPIIFNIEDRPDWTKIRIDKAQLCSYYYCELKGSGDEVIGTLHLAHVSNNYFSPPIIENITCFAREAGVIIQNAILYRQVTTMEREIRSVFSKFVPPEIINDLISRKGTSARAVSEKRRVAVLFSDIRSFTTLSETNSPEAVVGFLNRYLETMCEIILEHGGTVDKFIGDAILAIYGAPSSWPDNALRAVKTARAMTAALKTFDTEDIVLPPEGLAMGIGIHSGDAIVGNIGSSSKQEYTVIGDTVNLASRLEGLTKYYHRPILVSNDVLEEVRSSNDNPQDLPFRELEEVIVKGKGSATLIHVVEEVDELRLNGSESDHYAKALSMYRIKNWKLAEDYFNKVLETKPQDGISRMFRDRCSAFLRSAPPEDWDLIQRYLTK